jgi:hypothetical protein
MAARETKLLQFMNSPLASNEESLSRPIFSYFPLFIFFLFLGQAQTVRQTMRPDRQKYSAICGNGALTQNRYQRKTNFRCPPKSFRDGNRKGRGLIRQIPEIHKKRRRPHGTPPVSFLQLSSQRKSDQSSLRTSRRSAMRARLPVRPRR